MILELSEYREKLKGCWAGKNIGGILGAPFEAKRGIHDVSFYTQDLSKGIPGNDDLDLQLVWLNAVERYGKHIDATILGEYWLSYINPDWVEYGAGKANMKIGLAPPLSGYTNNPYRDSCGCFIRSEIWACLAPGHPDIAVRYAYQDAIVDHSTEGVYAEIFCAALQSSAFVEDDPLRLIEIGLSYIPGNCGVAAGVRTALSAQAQGYTWEEARKCVLSEVPGTFGLQHHPDYPKNSDIPEGVRGYDAPSNIGIMIIGWLYGLEDFGKCLCIAVNCGEDTDCTAATLGAILGIIRGFKGIPGKWLEPVGEKINTISINLTDIRQCLVNSIPDTISELSERIIQATPSILGGEICDYINSTNGYTIRMNEADKLDFKPQRINYWFDENFVEKIAASTFRVEYDFVIFKACLDYHEEPFIKRNEDKKFRLIIQNNIERQQWLDIIIHAGHEFAVTPSSRLSVYLDHRHMGKTEVEFSLGIENLAEPKYDILIEMRSEGRLKRGFIPITLLYGEYKLGI